MIIDVHCHIWDKHLMHPQAPTMWRKHAETISPELLLKLMNEVKIDKTVLFGVDFTLFPLFTGFREHNNYIASVIDKYPDRFIGFLAIDPSRGKEAIGEVDRCVDLGLKGVKLWPFGYYLDDSSFYPFYEKVREHNLPIMCHGGSGPPGTYLKHMKPEYIDTVAVDFPEITFILAHMGKPWVDTALRVARKNHNVYLDLSAWDDLYLNRPMYFIETIAKAKGICKLDKILFGSDWPVQLGGPTADHVRTDHMSFKEWFDVVKNLQIPEILKQLDYPEITEQDKRMILGENAAKILNL
jgi:predicted TIM-barrel fold metal-dependent hydrolase